MEGGKPKPEDSWALVHVACSVLGMGHFRRLGIAMRENGLITLSRENTDGQACVLIRNQ